jgi:hypothetical protein
MEASNPPSAPPMTDAEIDALQQHYLTPLAEKEGSLRITVLRLIATIRARSE